MSSSACAVDEFACRDGFCLPKSVQCDGVDNCGDMYDEKELCGRYIYWNALLRISALFYVL